MRQHLSRLPTIDPNTRTLLITGTISNIFFKPCFLAFRYLQRNQHGPLVEVFAKLIRVSSLVLFLLIEEILETYSEQYFKFNLILKHTRFYFHLFLYFSRLLILLVSLIIPWRSGTQLRCRLLQL